MCIIVVKLSLSLQKHVRYTMFMTQLLANASYNDLLNIKRLKRRIKCRLSSQGKRSFLNLHIHIYKQGIQLQYERHT